MRNIASNAKGKLNSNNSFERKENFAPAKISNLIFHKYAGDGIKLAPESNYKM